jgi:AcrR family transcriptional regulator
VSAEGGEGAGGPARRLDDDAARRDAPRAAACSARRMTADRREQSRPWDAAVAKTPWLLSYFESRDFLERARAAWPACAQGRPLSAPIALAAWLAVMRSCCAFRPCHSVATMLRATLAAGLAAAVLAGVREERKYVP